MKTAAVAWTFFVVTGLFVSLVLPLGEGFDEPWHLGYIQFVAQTGKLPPGPQLHLSMELENFMQRHPMGWRLHEIYPNLHTQEEYWQRAEGERSNDDTVIRQQRFSGSYVEAASHFTKQYESHQAPLYYVISAPLFLAFSRTLSLPDTFLLLRIWSVLLASAVVPLSYRLTKNICSSNLAPGAVAVFIAMFPGIYPDVARVSNDALVVPLAAAGFLGLSRLLESRSNRDAFTVGLLLLAGLWTKALFVPIVLGTLVGLVSVKAYRAAGTVTVVSAAGWLWYVRNLWVTGSMTGLPETVSTNATLVSSVQSAGSIHWWGVLKLAAISHIWMGNWSLLQYRSWIYETVLVFFSVGLAGFLFYLPKCRRTVSVLFVVYLAFTGSLLYYATQVFQQTGVAIIQGWYLSAVVMLEAIAFVLGIEFVFRRRGLLWCVIIVATCFLAMIIYGNAFIAAPYYTGITDHAPSGHLRAYHPHFADVSVMDSRLTRFYPWIPAAMPLLLVMAVTFTGFFLIWTFSRSSRS